MAYNLFLVFTVVIAASIGAFLGKKGPKWKGPLIALSIFIVFIVGANLLGFGS